MNWFDYAAPQSLTEALALIARHDKALPFVGGTDLLVQMRAGMKTADLLVDLKRIPELSVISFDAAGGLTLGAAVACCLVYENPAIRKTYPALAAVASLIGGVQVQSRASIGGNLCNAAPSGDSIPALIALRAVCRVDSAAGTRRIPVEDFCLAPGRNALQPGELLVALQLPPPGAASGSHYLRFIPRNEMDIAVAGAGVAVELEDGVFRWARIALSSVAPTPLFVREAGDWLAGKPVNQETIQAAVEMCQAAAKPISDMRGTADYRRHLAAVLTRRALEAAIGMAREARS
jgi:CO/xanthine dehydrogenase FAD-binding subunit